MIYAYMYYIIFFYNFPGYWRFGKPIATTRHTISNENTRESLDAKKRTKLWYIRRLNTTFPWYQRCIQWTLFHDWCLKTSQRLEQTILESLPMCKLLVVCFSTYYILYSELENFKKVHIQIPNTNKNNCIQHYLFDYIMHFSWNYLLLHDELISRIFWKW